MKVNIYRGLNELRQASSFNRTSTELRYSFFLNKVLLWLLKNGYIYSFEKIYRLQDKPSNRGLVPYLKVYLKYLKSGRGILSELVIFGSPAKSYILKARDASRVQNGVLLLSTTRGLLTLEEARRLNTGGLGLFLIRL